MPICNGCGYAHVLTVFWKVENLVTMNMSKTDYQHGDCTRVGNLRVPRHQNNTVEWNGLNWRKIQKAVFKLQKRIYQAYVNGDVKKGRRLQKTLVKSYYSRLLSVRKVSQDNQGKKRMRPRVAERRKTKALAACTRTKQTAGVDKVKSLTPKQRFFMAKHLKPGDKSKPIRRVWIPKPGKKEKRPLGIPVMRDRAVQALVKAALEPEWESKFEPSSYGFRPGRGAHDAIAAIFDSIHFKNKYVLDADISKCFDKISHRKLLQKLNTFPKFRRQIRAWLRADICDFVKHERNPNYEGIPQGGVISPLLANIALHGMETKIKEYAETFELKGVSKRDKRKSLSLIRYADDFVILHEKLDVIEHCQNIIKDWLAEYDLELKPEKTRIAHTLKNHNGEKPGFNFLGFNIRHYSVGKYQSGKCNGKILGFKTLIKPSDDSVKRHYAELSEVIRKHNAAPQAALVAKLNPKIRGWCNYYKTVCSKKTFSKVYHLLNYRLLAWGFRRHSNKPKHWVVRKYWKTVGNDNWIFGEKGEISLLKHTQVAIKRHIKVKGVSSPFDGNKTYWATRKGRYPELSDSVPRLLKKHKGLVRM